MASLVCHIHLKTNRIESILLNGIRSYRVTIMLLIELVSIYTCTLHLIVEALLAQIRLKFTRCAHSMLVTVDGQLITDLLSTYIKCTMHDDYNQSNNKWVYSVFMHSKWHAQVYAPMEYCSINSLLPVTGSHIEWLLSCRNSIAQRK